MQNKKQNRKKKKSNPIKSFFKLIFTLAIIAVILIASYGAYASIKLYLGYTGRIELIEPSYEDYPVRGVDVSRYQGNVDWDKINDNGVTFAFVKATEGDDYVDPYFVQNWTALENTSVYAGAYHYFSFGSSGATQAENFIKNVPYAENMLPPVVDFELTDEDESLEKSEVTQELKELLTTLENYYGVTPILYTTPKAYTKYLVFGYSKYTLWMRNTYCKPSLKWSFWQYEDEGKYENCYDGDQQFIDLNVYNGSRAKFLKEFSLVEK
jgi:lysozyme